MTPPLPEDAMLLSETWPRAIRGLEWRLALADGDERAGPYFEAVRNLRPLVDLTRQTAATKYGQSYRAGTSLRETLMLSTAAQHRLEPDEPYITVSIERTARGTFGFCILYYERGWGSEPSLPVPSVPVVTVRRAPPRLRPASPSIFTQTA